MTRLAVGFGRAFPRAWLVPITTLTIVLGIAATGRLSRSIVADLIAWWPVWLGLALAAYFLREHKVGQVRVAGLVPMAALFFVLVFVIGHLAGWAIMPSSSQRLVGPEVGSYTTAAMTAEVDGIIEVNAGSEFLYQVEPVKRGGGVGIPGAAEQIVDSTISIELQAPPDPGLYAYAGWRLFLSESPRWTLTLNGALEADLSSLTIDQLAVAGSGDVRLGAADGATQVTVDGAFTLTLPSGTPARVNGQASVPAGWVPDGSGATSGVSGEGWVIDILPGAVVTVSEAPAEGQ